MFLDKKTANTIPVTPVTRDELGKWLKEQDKSTQNWVKNAGFKGEAGKFILLQDTESGKIDRVLVGVAKDMDLYTFADLPSKLPANKAGYFLDTKLDGEDATAASLGWALGSYQFTRYKKDGDKDMAKLVWPKGADKDAVKMAADATFLVRDLINTPTNDMMPGDLEKAARALAKQFNDASFKVIRGDDLLKQNYPSIHAVGRASSQAPRLVDISWGKDSDPEVVICGKGVCFDTGGLNLKSGASMGLMKKDMGGAAHALGLAQMIMAAKLPVKLRVLVPIVENSVSDNAVRPGDIIDTRKGLKIEVDNTDAEGRLILADALNEGTSKKKGKKKGDLPKLVIDFATLTGAARVALGPEIPPFLTNDDSLARDLIESGEKTQDPVWQLPLHKPYLKYLKTENADLKNSGGGGMAGAITAALYLHEFVENNVPWIHVDTYGWNPSKKPGRTYGGEAYAMRASFDLIKKRFGGPK